MNNQELYDLVYQGMDASASLESYDALSKLLERLNHAEYKWHMWHIHTKTFGITCPKCKAA